MNAEKVEKKVEKTLFDDTKVYINQLCKTVELESLRSQVMPSIEKFSTQIGRFERSLKQSEQIIQRYAFKFLNNSPFLGLMRY